MKKYDKEHCTQYCIYKLKNGKTLNNKEQYYSKYVYLGHFARNPLTDEFICVFTYIDKYTLEPISQILSNGFLLSQDFEDKFETYLTFNEVQWIISELEGGGLT